jgi:hypothetical protein
MALTIENIVLLCVLVLLFLASIAVAIFPQYLLYLLSGWPSKLYLKMKRSLPYFITSGWEMWEEIFSGISDSRRISLAIWLYRIFAIIVAIVAAFFIAWILGLHRMFVG